MDFAKPKGGAPKERFHSQIKSSAPIAKKQDLSPRSTRKPLPTITWSSVNFKNTWRRWGLPRVRDMVMSHWSVDSSFWQLSIDHNMNLRFWISNINDISWQGWQDPDKVCNGRHVVRRRKARTPANQVPGHVDHENSNAWFYLFLCKRHSHGALLCGP